MGLFNLPYKILETQTMTAPAASVTFTLGTLVTDWDALAKVTSRHLAIIANVASPDAIPQRAIRLRFNGDVGANYNTQGLSGTNAVASAFRVDNQTHMEFATFPGTIYANAFGGGIGLIPHAFQAINHKIVLSLHGDVENDVNVYAGRWANTAAITSITLYSNVGNFATGSEFHLAVVDERYLVEEIELTADGLPVFRNIPQREGDLAVVAYVKSDRAAADNDGVNQNINDDAVAGNYLRQYLLGTGAAAPTAGSGATLAIGDCTAMGATPSAFASFLVSYSQPSKAANQPHWLIFNGMHELTGPLGQIILMSGRRANIEPITKLHYYPVNGTNFKAGSLFSLYHIPKRLIKRVELQVDTATVTFDSIPQDFEALVLNVYARANTAGASDNVQIEINNDGVAANYDRQFLRGQGAVVAALRSAAGRPVLSIPGATAGVNEFGGGSMSIPGYSKADRHKHILNLSGRVEDDIYLHSCRWEDVAAITEIDIEVESNPGVRSFKHGSVFELWGILPVEGLPAITVGG